MTASPTPSGQTRLGAPAGPGACAAVVATLATILSTAACRPRAPTPGQALREYGAAVAEGRWAVAYRDLSADYRARVSLPAYTAVMQAARERSVSLGATLAAEGDLRARRIEVELPRQERAELVLEGNAWRLDRPPYPPFDLATPRSALRTFVWAVESKQYEELIALAPAAYRARLDANKVRLYWETRGVESTRALLGALLLVLDAPIFEHGDHAHAAYAGDRMVRWVREPDGWRIASPE